MGQARDRRSTTRRSGSRLDRVGSILKNDKYVNAGIGDVKSIATTTFQDGGLPVASGECAMHRQASFYANFWPEGTKVEEGGDVFAFYLPDDQRGQRQAGSRWWRVHRRVQRQRPRSQAFQTYLSSDTWANEKAKATPSGGWVSANKGLDVNNLVSPIDKLSAEIFQDPNAVFRFDGSDLMPGAVGSGSFWKEMTAWITGKSTKERPRQASRAPGRRPEHHNLRGRRHRGTPQHSKD